MLLVNVIVLGIYGKNSYELYMVQIPQIGDFISLPDNEDDVFEVKVIYFNTFTEEQVKLPLFEPVAYIRVKEV